MTGKGGPLLLEGQGVIAAVEQDHGREGSRTFRTDQHPPQRHPGLLLQLDPLGFGLFDRKPWRFT